MITPNSEDPADDERWREWIAAADPGQSGTTEDSQYSAALERLHAQLSHVLEEHRLVQSQEPAALPPITRLNQLWRGEGGRGRRFRPLILAASIAAVGMIAVVGSLWWKPTSDVLTQPPAHEHPDATPRIDSMVQSPPPQMQQPSSDSNPSPETSSETVAASSRSRGKIQTVSELIKLSPSQLVRVQRRLDRVALEEELQAWLRSWSESTPDGRTVLEQQWVSNRGFWSSWTLRGLRHWADPTVLQAGIEVLCLELGPQAAETLAFCYDRPETRDISLLYLLPSASETQIVQWLQSAEDSGVVPRLITELARRPGPTATETLSHLASDKVCRQLLHRLPWNAAHATRAVNALNTPYPAQQYRAAMLLAVIDLPVVDDLLLQKANSGVQTVPTMATLLLRHENAADQLAEKIRHSPTVLASIPSATQRVQRWMRQHRSEVPSPDSFRKVCELCVTAT